MASIPAQFNEMPERTTSQFRQDAHRVKRHLNIMPMSRTTLHYFVNGGPRTSVDDAKSRATFDVDLASDVVDIVEPTERKLDLRRLPPT